MKMPFKVSVKHVQINKAANTMMFAAAIACVITAFSLLSAKALLSQSSYQHKVLKQRNAAVKQLKENVSAAETLKTQYDVFAKGNPNIIGGQGGIGTTGTGPNDGDNARIVLDALPSQYDFPALTSSLEKIVTLDNIAIEGIGGTDAGTDSGQNNASGGGSQQSQASPMAFSLTATSDYNGTQKLIKDFERSIRPFDITNLSLSGSSKALSASIQANTYYQPGVSLQITQEAVH